MSRGVIEWNVANVGVHMPRILIEVVPRPSATGELRRGAPHISEDFVPRANELMAATLEIAEHLRSTLETSSLSHGAGATADTWALREVEMKFGLELQAEAGVIVAKVGGTASFDITLTWKRGP